MLKRKAVDTLIMSDIHLGSEVSRPEAALATLKNHSFRRLILLGDIFDDLNFHRLSREHWELLSYIRLLTNRKRRVEVIWVVGNHDELLVDIMKYLIGSEVKQNFYWEENGRKFFAIHGHQFDYFLVQNRIMSNVATLIYRIIQKLDTKRQRLSRYIKRASKGWLRISKDVADGAVKMGEKKARIMSSAAIRTRHSIGIFGTLSISTRVAGRTFPRATSRLRMAFPNYTK